MNKSYRSLIALAALACAAMASIAFAAPAQIATPGTAINASAVNAATPPMSACVKVSATIAAPAVFDCVAADERSYLFPRAMAVAPAMSASGTVQPSGLSYGASERYEKRAG